MGVGEARANPLNRQEQPRSGINFGCSFAAREGRGYLNGSSGAGDWPRGIRRGGTSPLLPLVLRAS